MTVNFLTNRINNDFRQGLTKILDDCAPYQCNNDFIINIASCDDDLIKIGFFAVGCDFAVHTCYLFNDELNIDYLIKHYSEFYCAFKLLRAFVKSNCDIKLFI